MNPFDILGIQPGASSDEIKAAYHKLAKMWHPDRYSGPQKDEAEGKFRDISEAFNILKDPERRVWAEEEYVKTAPAPAAAPAAPSAPADGGSPKGAGERSPDDWYHDAILAFKELDTDRAQGLVQFAIRQDPNKAEYHLFLAKLLETKGSDLRAIIKAYESVVKLSPKDIESTVRLADHFQALGMHAKASALILKAKEIAPRHKLLRKYGVAEDAASESKPKALDLKDLGSLGGQAKALFNKILRRG